MNTSLPFPLRCMARAQRLVELLCQISASPQNIPESPGFDPLRAPRKGVTDCRLAIRRPMRTATQHRVPSDLTIELRPICICARPKFPTRDPMVHFRLFLVCPELSSLVCVCCLSAAGFPPSPPSLLTELIGSVIGLAHQFIK